MKDPIKQAAQRAASDFMICHTYNMVLRFAQVSENMIAAAESEALEKIGLQRLVQRDPAMSDHVSAEVRDAIADLLNDAREMRATLAS